MYGTIVWVFTHPTYAGDDFIWGSANGGCKCERESHDISHESHDYHVTVGVYTRVSVHVSRPLYAARRDTHALQPCGE